MADTPVVLLSSARQTGKTTLAKAIAKTTGANYFTLDDTATLVLIAGAPSGFICDRNRSWGRKVAQAFPPAQFR